MFVNFYFLFTAIAGFSEYKPMGLFWDGGKGGEELILGIKNKLRNAWAYFRGGLFSGFYGIFDWVLNTPLVRKISLFCNNIRYHFDANVNTLIQ